MNVLGRAGIAAAIFVLAACAAPRMENLKNPGADFHADMSACEREAERVVKLDRLARPIVLNNCYRCEAQGHRELQDALSAQGAQKRCMAARGWQEAR